MLGGDLGHTQALSSANAKAVRNDIVPRVDGFEEEEFLEGSVLPMLNWFCVGRSGSREVESIPDALRELGCTGQAKENPWGDGERGTVYSGALTETLL